MIYQRNRRPKQGGYILLILLLMVALLMLAVTAAAPRIAQQAKRDRENEMIHRGAEYARAVKRYYRKFGRYPTSLDQLQDTNHMRFLRKAYADPMTQDGKWRVLHPGDVQIGGASVGTPVSALASKTQPSSLSPTGPTGEPQQKPGTSTTTTSGMNNQQFGGFIIGVASMSEAEGIHEFAGKSKYKEWYFVYDPTTDRGGLISGPYTGKVFSFGNSTIPGATPAGQPNGLGRPMGGLGQPSNNGGFGQPMGGAGPIGTPQPPPKQ